MRKQVISFTIEPELEEYLRRMADKAHLSVSQYLRNLLWTGKKVEELSTEEVAFEYLPKEERIKRVNFDESF